MSNILEGLYQFFIIFFCFATFFVTMNFSYVCMKNLVKIYLKGVDKIDVILKKKYNRKLNPRIFRFDWIDIKDTNF